MSKGQTQLGYELHLARAWDQRLGPAPPGSSGRDLLRGGHGACLLTVLRLAAHRGPEMGTGTGLAAALVRAGHLARAVELVRSSAGRSGPGDDLVRLVRTAGGAGDVDGARALAESLPDRSLRDRALVAHIPAVARAGGHERAADLAEGIRYPHNRPMAWAVLAETVAESGDFPAALGYAARAAEHAGHHPDAGHVLVRLMKITHAAGDHVLAGTYADRVEGFVRSEGRAGTGRGGALVAVLAFEAGNGDLDRLDALLRGLARADRAVADGPQANTGDPHVLCLTILARPRPPLDAKAVTELLEAVTGTVDQEVALALADRAEQLLRRDGGFDSLALRAAVTLLLARHGQVERAMALADRIVEPDLRAARQAEIVEALARSGDTARAEALAGAFTDRWARSRALIGVVGELARCGRTARAEALARTIPDRWGQGEALIGVVRELARQGESERAEDLADTILHRATRARALAALLEVSEPARARRLAARAVFLGGWPIVLEHLEKIAPGGARVIADEVMTWQEACLGTAEGAGQ
ncbi:hypothetical protein [Kitasatospora paranensis]|uniref:Uncharacterized protein n=1 Tax=Kitasatospora paranensis TaxID=258053 RepID=A0ABW2FSL6_9ACTN